MNNQVLVDRELLERCCKRMYDMMQGDLHKQLRALLATPTTIPDAVEGAEHLPDSAFQDEFQVWWEEEGQYVRSGGGAYERTFAFQAWRHLMPKLVSALQASAMVVPDIDEMVSRFLSWPLPADVFADPCASMPGYPHRHGTNLLTAVQAKAMLSFVLAASPAPGDK